MRIAPLNERVNGERLGQAIFDRRGRVLLAAGIELSPYYVEVLRRGGYLSVPLLARSVHSDPGKDACGPRGSSGRIQRGAVLRLVDNWFWSQSPIEGSTVI